MSKEKERLTGLDISGMEVVCESIVRQIIKDLNDEQLENNPRLGNIMEFELKSATRRLTDTYYADKIEIALLALYLYNLAWVAYRLDRGDWIMDIDQVITDDLGEGVINTKPRVPILFEGGNNRVNYNKIDYQQFQKS